MLFFLLDIIVIAVCIYGINRLARWFDFPLDPRALLLCAVMALVINFSAIYISSYLTAAHYLLLAVLVFAAAVFVTFCNERFFRRPTTNAYENLPCFAEIPHPDMPVPAAEIPVPAEAMLPAETCQPEADYPVIPAETTEPQPAAEAEPEISLFDEISNRFEAELASRHDEIEANLAAAAAEAFATTADDIAAEEASEEYADAFVPLPEEASAADEDTAAWQEPVTEEEPAADEEPVTEGELFPAEDTAAEEEAPAETIEEPPFDAEKVAGFTTLDEILDYAYEQKQLCYYQNAIYTYEQALIRYSDDDYAPFIVIDMANICKAAGQYRKAIAIYQLAFTLRAVRSSKTMCKDFNNTLAYLEAVEYILSQHNAPELPYAEIPSEYLEEIEQDFAVRQKENSVS